MPDDLLQRFASLRTFSQAGKLAPHKPLLLLYALARLKGSGVDRIAFDEAEKVVDPLIAAYGPFGVKSTVAYPFARLANDASSIWQVGPHGKTSSGDLLIGEARETKLKAGFSADVLDAFRAEPGLIDAVALDQLERNFPPTLHRDILEALGLQLGTDTPDADNRPGRSPKFRRDVLSAYYEQCCVCRYDMKMNGAAVALDAAHIKMHAVGGPDEVGNGLALCVIHHKLFDLGAITLDAEMRLHVSGQVVGDWGRRLADEFHGREIALPRNAEMNPAPEFVRWHNTQIFKGLI